MRRYLLAALLFTLVSAARADVFRLTIDSADYNDGHYGVGLYHSTLQINENLVVPLLTTCIDFTSHVGFGQSFQVTVVNLANFTGPLHNDYWEAGWLALQLAHTTDAATVSDIQRAIWLITTPGTNDPYLTTNSAFGWVLQAQQNYQSVSDSMFVLYLKVGDVGQSQLAVVPEPATYTIFVMAFGAFFIVQSIYRRFRNAPPR